MGTSRPHEIRAIQAARTTEHVVESRVLERDETETDLRDTRATMRDVMRRGRDRR